MGLMMRFGRFLSGWPFLIAHTSVAILGVVLGWFDGRDWLLVVSFLFLLVVPGLLVSFATKRSNRKLL